MLPKRVDTVDEALDIVLFSKTEQMVDVLIVKDEIEHIFRVAIDEDDWAHIFSFSSDINLDESMSEITLYSEMNKENAKKLASMFVNYLMSL